MGLKKNLWIVYTCIISGAPPHVGEWIPFSMRTEHPHCMVPYLEWMLVGDANISFKSLNRWNWTTWVNEIWRLWIWWVNTPETVMTLTSQKWRTSKVNSLGSGGQASNRFAGGMQNNGETRITEDGVSHNFKQGNLCFIKCQWGDYVPMSQNPATLRTRTFNSWFMDVYFPSHVVIP